MFFWFELKVRKHHVSKWSIHLSLPRKHAKEYCLVIKCGIPNTIFGDTKVYHYKPVIYVLPLHMLTLHMSSQLHGHTRHEICNLWGIYALLWRHKWRDDISSHQPHDCLLNRSFRRRSKKTSKLRVTGICAGNSQVIGEFPAQMASNAENVSIWWRHHGWPEGKGKYCGVLMFSLMLSWTTRWAKKRGAVIYDAFTLLWSRCNVLGRNGYLISDFIEFYSTRATCHKVTRSPGHS